MSLIKNNDTNNFYPVSIPDTDWHCDYLWSTHRGCSFDCLYCSSKRLNVRFGGDPCEIRRLKGEWKSSNISTRLPINSGIFISPYNDLMTVGDNDIKEVLQICNMLKSSSFIFQTKDPAKYFDYIDLIPQGSWLGTTISSTINRLDIEPNAPLLSGRYTSMVCLPFAYKKFVTIEPIMDFELDTMIEWMSEIKPDVIFIGGNTSNVKLPEPTPDELIELIEQLRKITTVYLKSNLKRLLPKTNSWVSDTSNVTRFMG